MKLLDEYEELLDKYGASIKELAEKGDIPAASLRFQEYMDKLRKWTPRWMEQAGHISTLSLRERKEVEERLSQLDQKARDASVIVSTPHETE